MEDCPDRGFCRDACVSTCYDSLLLDFVDRCCDCSDTCELVGWRGSIALVILLLTLMLLAKRRWAWMPLGRVMGASACAVFMVGAESGFLPAATILDLTGVIDVTTLATLFGLTIMTGFLDEVGLLQRLSDLLSRKCASPMQLLLRVVVVTSVTSALFTNDAAVSHARCDDW